MPGTELDAAVFLTFFSGAPDIPDDGEHTGPGDDAIIEYLGKGAQASGTGAIVVALPAASLQADDLLLLFVENASQSITTPSGWTLLANYAGGTGGGADGARASVFWKRATGSGDTGASVNDSGDHTSGIILAFRGVIATGTPVVSRSAAASLLVTTRNITQLANITKRSMLVWFAIKESAGGTVTIVQGGDHTYKGFTDLGIIIDHTDGNDGALAVAMGRAKSSRAYSSPSAVVTRNDSGTIVVGCIEILAGPA